MTESFIYANGRISGKEATFLDRRMWQMLISAGDVGEATRLLGDTWYGGYMQYHSLEECFIRVMETTENELLELSEDERLVKGILHRRDVRNARYIWKKFLSGEDQEIEVERNGLIDTDILRKSIKSDEARDELPPPFLIVLEELLENAETGKPEIDSLMDKLAAAVARDELAGINPGLSKFVMTSLEQKNFLTAGRCSIDEVPRQEMRRMLLRGGYHTEDEIEEAYQRKTLPLLLAEIPGLEKTGAALEEAFQDGSFLGFERESDKRLMELLEEEAFPVFGPSPLAAFVLRRELEINHLRLLLAAKSAGVSENILKKRLPRG